MDGLVPCLEVVTDRRRPASQPDRLHAAGCGGHAFQSGRDHGRVDPGQTPHRRRRDECPDGLAAHDAGIDHLVDPVGDDPESRSTRPETQFPRRHVASCRQPEGHDPGRRDPRHPQHGRIVPVEHGDAVVLEGPHHHRLLLPQPAGIGETADMIGGDRCHHDDVRPKTGRVPRHLSGAADADFEHGKRRRARLTHEIPPDVREASVARVHPVRSLPPQHGHRRPGRRRLPDRSGDDHQSLPGSRRRTPQRGGEVRGAPGLRAEDLADPVPEEECVAAEPPHSLPESRRCESRCHGRMCSSFGLSPVFAGGSR